MSKKLRDSTIYCFENLLIICNKITFCNDILGCPGIDLDRGLVSTTGFAFSILKIAEEYESQSLNFEPTKIIKLTFDIF